MKSRWGWGIGICTVVAAFCGGFAAQAVLGGTAAHAQEAPADEVRARALVLVGERGQELARIEAGEWGHGLVVSDAEGNPRIVLGMMPQDQAGLIFKTADQKTQLALGAFEKANHMDIYDGQQRPRFTVGISREDGNGGLVFYDADKNDRLAIGMGPGGGGDFVVKDQFGNDLWRAMEPVGMPELP